MLAYYYSLPLWMRLSPARRCAHVCGERKKRVYMWWWTRHRLAPNQAMWTLSELKPAAAAKLSSKMCFPKNRERSPMCMHSERAYKYPTIRVDAIWPKRCLDGRHTGELRRSHGNFPFTNCALFSTGDDVPISRREHLPVAFKVTGQEKPDLRAGSFVFRQSPINQRLTLAKPMPIRAHCP